VAVAERVRRRLIAEGLLEAMTLPMVAASGEGIRLLNPVSEEHGMLRTRLLPNLVRQVELNWSRRERDVRLFEIGAAFSAAGAGELPHESQRVAAVITGSRAPEHWTGAAPDFDQWDLKAVFESAVEVAAPRAAIEPDGEGWVARNPDGRAVGTAGPLMADAPPWAGPVFGLELELDLVPRPAVRFVPRPATPSSERDVTLLVPDGTAAGDLVRVLSGGGVTVLESVRIVNAYRGERVPAGTRSVTFRLTFRAPDRTLEAAEIDSAEAHLLLLLERETGVRRREQ
jgi:phenylalanyl-tRNA synthetase beta chain